MDASAHACKVYDEFEDFAMACATRYVEREEAIAAKEASGAKDDE